MDRVEIICENDEKAKRCARQLVDGYAIELWQAARMIAAFKPE